MDIKNVVAISPCYNETLGMIQSFMTEIEKARHELNQLGVGFTHLFLDDGALNLPPDYSILVRHEKNQGLAKTLYDGYDMARYLKIKWDLLIRIDVQEHDVSMIPKIVDHMANSKAEAMFLPVCYWVKNEPRLPMKDVVRSIAKFVDGINPINREIVLSTYNQTFPLGYQSFSRSALEKIMPDIASGMAEFENLTGKKPTWGLDLLSILLAAKYLSDKLDFMFGGWSTPWLENRGADKIEAQKERARIMLEVAARLDCEFK